MRKPGKTESNPSTCRSRLQKRVGGSWRAVSGRNRSDYNERRMWAQCRREEPRSMVADVKLEKSRAGNCPGAKRSETGRMAVEAGR